MTQPCLIEIAGDPALHQPPRYRLTEDTRITRLEDEALMRGITLLGPVHSLQIQAAEHLPDRYELMTDSGASLTTDSLEDVIRSAFHLAARFRLPVAADVLQPGPVVIEMRGTPPRQLRFMNAETLYQALRRGYLGREGRLRARLEDVTLHGTWDGEAATCALVPGQPVLAQQVWTVAVTRLLDPGHLPTHLPIPPGACPQCLSRFVLHYAGEGFLCQECLYEPAHVTF